MCLGLLFAMNRSGGPETWAATRTPRAQAPVFRDSATGQNTGWVAISTSPQRSTRVPAAGQRITTVNVRCRAVDLDTPASTYSVVWMPATSRIAQPGSA